MLTPFPGTVDFAAWEKTMESDPTRIDGMPLTRHWLIPKGKQPKRAPTPAAKQATVVRSRLTQGSCFVVHHRGGDGVLALRAGLGRRARWRRRRGPTAGGRRAARRSS